jgi:hypothetical protein
MPHTSDHTRPARRGWGNAAARCAGTSVAMRATRTNRASQMTAAKSDDGMSGSSARLLRRCPNPPPGFAGRSCRGPSVTDELNDWDAAAGRCHPTTGTRQNIRSRSDRHAPTRDEHAVRGAQAERDDRVGAKFGPRIDAARRSRRYHSAHVGTEGARTATARRRPLRLRLTLERVKRLRVGRSWESGYAWRWP